MNKYEKNKEKSFYTNYKEDLEGFIKYRKIGIISIIILALIGYYYDLEFLYWVILLIGIVGIKEEGVRLGIIKGFYKGYDEGYEEMQEKADL